MGDAGEDEDYRYYGTPIEIEIESKAGQYRKEPHKDSGATRHLPTHQQEVTDAQGRRRFHGAFTGGFSAGYFNTVGSKEGWAPASFKSSRSDRHTAQLQNIEQFLDEDELEELRKTNLQTSATYDTFGDTAAEAARQAAMDEASHRPSAIPGLLPEEAVVPVAEGIGIQLLQKMGWRQGKGIGTAGPARQKESARGFGQIAGVGPENTPLHLIKPKHDVHGLGYDPFKGAEEFRKAREERRKAAGPRGPRGGTSGARQRGVAFGSGVLDEDDSYGILEDYVTHDGVESYEEVAGMDAEGMPLGRGPKVDKKFVGDRLALQGFAYEVQDEEESDEDLPGGSFRATKTLQLTGPAVPLALQSAEHARRKSLIPGFVLATEDGGIQRPEYYTPPEIPADYVPVHKPAPKPAVEAGTADASAAPRPPAFALPPPTNPTLRQEIERLAFFVAKNGPSFEALARQQQIKAGGAHGAPMFLLPGGEGASFYQWKLATLRALLAPKGKNTAVQSVLKPIGQRSVPLSAEDRGALLGEQPLPSGGGAFQSPQQQAPVPLAKSLLQVAEVDRQRLAAAMSSTFVRAEKQEMLQPEQPVAGLKPGLRPGAPREAARKEQDAAPAAAAPPPQPRGIVTIQDLSRPLTDTSGGMFCVDTAGKGDAVPILPVRKTEEWRPEPLLCKRLDVPDPYKGRPKELQMSRFRTDHISLPATAEAMGRAAAKAAPTAPGFLLPPSVKVAAEEAAATAQLAAEKPAEELIEAVDASNAAEAFLSALLDATGSGAGEEAGEVGGGGKGTAQAAEEKKLIEEVAAIEKPVDLFKAIFEDSSESESETKDVEKTGAGDGGADAAAVGAETAGRGVQRPEESDKTFGFDKFKRNGGESAAMGSGRGDVVGGGALDEKKGLHALDPAVMSRVEAALKLLEESKKRKKEKKDRKERKSSKRKKSRKDRKKDRRHKSSSKHKKRRLGNKDQDKTSNDDTDSSDDTGSTNTDSE